MKISDSHTKMSWDSSERQYRETMYRMFYSGNNKLKVKKSKTAQAKSIKVKADSPRAAKPKSYIDKLAVSVASTPSSYPVKVKTFPKVNKDDFLADEITTTNRRPLRMLVMGFYNRHRIVVMRVCFATLSFVLIVSSLLIFKSTFKQDTPRVAGTSYIAPETVFLPKQLPEGFTVGSSKQELENGALLYTVFGPKGEEITITQQMSSPNFDQKILEGGFKFTTPHGTAYVLDNTERVTGYLLAEDSWVLLNNYDGIRPEDMRTLIRALEPI